MAMCELQVNFVKPGCFHKKRYKIHCGKNKTCGQIVMMECNVISFPGEGKKKVYIKQCSVRIPNARGKGKSIEMTSLFAVAIVAKNGYLFPFCIIPFDKNML
ncbi:hypothetical protein COOONC_17638 [Cooperia oncophora]